MRPESVQRVERAAALMERGQLVESRDILLREVRTNPQSAPICDLLRLVCARMGAFDQALYYAQRCAVLDPTNAGVMTDLGLIHLQLGQNGPAEKALRRAVELDAGYVPAYRGLAAVLIATQRLAEAERVCGAGLVVAPGDFELEMKLGAVEMETLRIGSAFDRVRRLSQGSRGGGMAEYLATLANYAGLFAEGAHEVLTPVGISALHRRVGEAIGRGAKPGESLPRHDGPLRVAFISPDFRRHPVAAFIRPVLEGADRSRVRVIGVATGVADAITPTLAKVCDEWIDASKLNAEALEETLRALKLDVAIDLAGLTLAGTLGALRHRPARVQMTYLGYPNTTGCSFIDYRIVDGETDPAGSEGLCTEKLLRVEGCFLGYALPNLMPPRQQRSEGGVVLACFNRLQKVSGQTLRMWSAIMSKLPDARFVLKDSCLSDGPTRAVVAGELQKAGIDPGRVDLLPMDATSEQHLQRLGRADIALDPYPYHGTTTTCEALLMSTPVVTLAGPAHVARVGVSILKCCGLDELIADTPERYVELVVGLASDRARLEAYHATIRERFVSSPIARGDFAARFVRTIESVMR